MCILYSNMVNAWIQHVKSSVTPSMPYQKAMVSPKVRAAYYEKHPTSCARKVNSLLAKKRVAKPKATMKPPPAPKKKRKPRKKKVEA